MVTAKQVRKLWPLLTTGKTLAAAAAARTEMGRKSGGCHALRYTEGRAE